MSKCGLACLLLVCAAFSGNGRADEGMWPLQQLPTPAMRQQHAGELTPEWLTRV